MAGEGQGREASKWTKGERKRSQPLIPGFATKKVFYKNYFLNKFS